MVVLLCTEDSLILQHSELPGRLHELDEVIVVVNGRRDSGVVVVPLSTLNTAISVSVTEVSQEFEENLVFSHLSGDDLRVEGGVVDALKVGGLDGATAIAVELEESLVDHGLALGVEFSLHMRKDSFVRVVFSNMVIYSRKLCRRFSIFQI